MKVGILTACRTDNIGTDLQAAAMYKIFTGIGYDVEVIDYACKKLDSSKNILPSLSFKSNIKIPWKVFKHFSHKNFRKHEFKKSEITVYPKNFSLSGYDIIVVGSDQIWNLDITGGDTNFFLPVPSSIKKFSYAASVGVNNMSEWNDKYKLYDMLLDFSGISVREKSSVIAMNTIGISAREDLDPILCLSKNDWLQLKSKKPFKNKHKYVVIYLVGGNEKVEIAARKYASENNCDIIAISSPTFPTKGIKTKFFVSIYKWINIIDGAEMVFTNSYHGLSASVALNTNFRLASLSNEQSNLRSLSLLKKLDLEDFILSDNINFTKIPPWNYVNNKLEKLKEQSFEYIKSMGQRSK